MNKEDYLLLEILKISLWEGQPKDSLIPDAVRSELRAHAVEGLTALAYPDGSILEQKLMGRFVRMADAQAGAVRILQEDQIPAVVLKGMAAGIYYPVPYLRSYGDIDLMVLPEDYRKAISLMRENGYFQDGDVGKSHTAFWKDDFLFELHQSPPGMETVPEGEYMIRYMREGFSDIRTGVIDNDDFSFPMFPWQQNGLELIWHIREHLYNGIGLRHVTDWMMFAHCCLEDAAFDGYREVLEKAGLLTLAKTLTRMCQVYLGLEETITWCRDVPEELCGELMEYILEQGNFGSKRKDDKAVKVLTRYRTPVAFLKGMQQKGLNEWEAAKKHPVLRPLAWAHVGIRGCGKYLKPEGLKKIRTEWAENKRRRRLFDQLYGGNHSGSAETDI